MYDYANLKEDLVGKKILRIYLDEDNLRFDTDGGTFCYVVTGECCSNSWFNDFFGVRNLLDNGPVMDVEEIELTEDDEERIKKWLPKDYEELKFYGYRLTTEHPTFGPVSSVFSFRNDSNGFYGGILEKSEVRDGIPEITDDVLETSKRDKK